MFTEAKRSTFLKLLLYFFHELVPMHLVNDKLIYVTLFRLLYKIIQPAVIIEALRRRLNDHSITLHFGLIACQ